MTDRREQTQAANEFDDEGAATEALPTASRAEAPSPSNDVEELEQTPEDITGGDASSETTEDEAETSPVIHLPAHNDDLTESIPPSVSDETPARSSAAHWLDRFKSFAHDAPAPVSADPVGKEADESETPLASESTLADVFPDEPPSPDIQDKGTTSEPASPPEANEPETLTCPVCGQQTDALRFCGYCGAQLQVGRTDATRFGSLLQRARAVIDPSRHAVSTTPHVLTLAAGALLVLIALLANSAGTALIVLCALIPILILITLNQHDVFENEHSLILAGSVAAGAVAGVIIAWVGSWILDANWFKTGSLNYGAGGFGGRFAETAGSAPFLVWFINGIVLPFIGLASILAAPIALRRLNQFRNEVMDGMILAGGAAAGFAVGSAIVFWAPLFRRGEPTIDVSDWTLMIIGMGVLRPIIITLSGAMLGAGIWRYMMSPRQRVLIVPAAGSIGGMLLLYLGSIWIQPSGGGLWPETLWLVLVAVAAFILYRMVLATAIQEDRKALGSDGTRMICPHCHRLTLTGTYCSRCGQPLPVPAEPTPGAGKAADS